MATTYGVTVNGYVLKTQADINSEAQTALLDVKDPVTGDSLQANLSDPSDIVSEVTAITLEGVGDGLQVDQAAYNQYNPSAATGDALSTVVIINGIERQAATPSTVLLNFTGSPNILIPATDAIEVTDSNNANIWLVTEDFTFTAGGIANAVPATCQTNGAITANAGTLTQLLTPNADILTVTNPALAQTGSNEETDPELRQRRDKSTEAPSIGLPASLFSALSNLEDVTFARVYNNILITTDSNGIPPKSVACVVVGGDTNTIAQTIFSRSSNGTAFFGNTSVTFQDIQGINYTIEFFRPTAIPIYLIVEVTIVEADVFPADGDTQIKDAIVAYSTGGAPALGINDGFDTEGFPPGTDVLASRLYTPINSVPGHKIDELLLGTAPVPTLPNDIPIGFNEVSEFLDINITVIVNA